MRREAIGRLMAALQGIYQCPSLSSDLKRCLLTEGHESELCIWSDGETTITWKAVRR